MAREKASTNAVMLEGSSNLPNTGYASLPSQMRSGSMVHVFFPEPTIFAADL